MKFNTDSHFVIGRYHIRQNKPCQDHARDDSREGLAITVVSDGCSSGGHTDIGSRVVTSSAIRVLTKHGYDPHQQDSPHYIKGAIIDNLIDSRAVLSITNEDMLATCGYVIVDKDGGFIHLIGDGCVAIKYKNGDIDFVVIDWQNNTPYYPVYSISNSYYDFVASHETVNEGKEAMKVTTGAISSIEESMHEFYTWKPVLDAIDGYILPIKSLENMECIAIFSDGVQDFQQADYAKRIPVKQVIHEMMNFKNYTGEFVKRRISAALKKFAKEDIHPGDDFSMAVIHFNHEEVSNE